MTMTDHRFQLLAAWSRSRSNAVCELRWVITLGVLLHVWTASPVALASEIVARQVEPGVVRIYAIGSASVTSGTGFVIADDGWIATNYHVVSDYIDLGGALEVVASGDDEHRRKADVVGFWPGEDLAILRAEGLDRPWLTIARDQGIGAGVTVFALGFPGAADRLGPVAVASFVQGTVSRQFEGRWSSGGDPLTIIQHTAAINPGNSGGPLVNACGQVVGINTQREMRAILGPGGIPLVFDPIQAMFFSSGASALAVRIDELGLPLHRAADSCVNDTKARLDSILWLAIVGGVLAAASLVLTTFFRPRPVVNVLVRCEAAVEHCIKAVRRAMTGHH